MAVVFHPFAAITVASVFCTYIIHDACGPSRRYIIYLTPVPVAMAFMAQRWGAPTPLPMLMMLSGLGVLGALGFVVAAYCASDPAQRSQRLTQLAGAMVLPVAASMLAFGLWSTYTVNPVYDTRVFAFEAILGVKFSLLGVWTFHHLAPLSGISAACYVALPIGMSLVVAAQRDPRRQLDVLMANVVAGACGFALYFVCPVVGPLNAFGSPYPNALPPISPDSPLITAAFGAPRNGMPSLHTIWALLIWFNAQTLPVAWRRALRVFAVMNLWAAMGLDDTHWLMDIVVSVPIAVAIQAAFVIGVRRTWIDVATCATLTAMWLIGFRAGVPLLSLPATVAWMAVAVTVCWPLIRLARGRQIQVLRTDVASHSPSGAAPWATRLARTHSE